METWIIWSTPSYGPTTSKSSLRLFHIFERTATTRRLSCTKHTLGPLETSFILNRMLTYMHKQSWIKGDLSELVRLQTETSTRNRVPCLQILHICMRVCNHVEAFLHMRSAIRLSFAASISKEHPETSICVFTQLNFMQLSVICQEQEMANGAGLDSTGTQTHSC